MGAAAAALPGVVRAAGGDTARPNVLFIAIDDLNDWVGCLGGHPDAKTPHLDALAKRGVLFTRAYCSAPACGPSRAALMTGILPSTSGVYHNAQPWRPVMPKAITIPQHFMAHGYNALGGGKIYHGAFPDPASWESYFPSQKQSKPPDPVPPKRPVNGIANTSHFDWGPVDVADSEMGDYKVVEWAKGEMGRIRDKPVFLACGMFRPHLPWYVPRKYFNAFPPEKVTLPRIKEDDLDDIPPMGKKIAKPQGDHKNVIEHNQWRRAVSGYLASISFTDTMIGRLIAAFDKSPMAKNTVIVLWSDHGWHLGEKLHWRKFSLWEEATHDVLMVIAPGVTTPGGRCDTPVGHIDIYPTLIELCGLAPKKELAGESLVPLLKDPSATRESPALTTHGRGNHSLRTRRWRYIRYNDGTEELYDHDVDEMEWTNVAGKSKHAELKKKLARWLPKTNAPDAPNGRTKKKTRDKTAKGASGRKTREQ